VLVPFLIASFTLAILVRVTVFYLEPIGRLRK
jgi:hypothetical protein